LLQWLRKTKKVEVLIHARLQPGDRGEGKTETV
jgi:hypothetical protein